MAAPAALTVRPYEGAEELSSCAHLRRVSGSREKGGKGEGVLLMTPSTGLAIVPVCPTAIRTGGGLCCKDGGVRLYYPA